jgi:hypothetical protein
MSDEIRDVMVRSYPEDPVVPPPAVELWERGRRRHRRVRTVQAVGALMCVVVLAGVGAVFGLPDSLMSTDPTPHVGSSPEGSGPAEQDEATIREEADAGDVPSDHAREVIERWENQKPSPGPTETGQDQGQGAMNYPEANMGATQAPNGWEPSKAPPIDLSELAVQDGQAPWYANRETETGLADRGMLEDRIGAEETAQLCGWLERESDRANQALQAQEDTEGTVAVSVVARHLLRANGVTGGDGLPVVVAAGCLS